MVLLPVIYVLRSIYVSKQNQINRIEAEKIEEFIKKLSIDELHLLNRLVVQRVKTLRQIETSEAMRRFNIGDQVTFTDNYGNMIEGRITKINKKTVSVESKNYARWNVHPSLLEYR